MDKRVVYGLTGLVVVLGGYYLYKRAGGAIGSGLDSVAGSIGDGLIAAKDAVSNAFGITPTPRGDPYNNPRVQLAPGSRENIAVIDTAPKGLRKYDGTFDPADQSKSITAWYCANLPIGHHKTVQCNYLDDDLAIHNSRALAAMPPLVKSNYDPKLADSIWSTSAPYAKIRDKGRSISVLPMASAVVPRGQQSSDLPVTEVVSIRNRLQRP